MWAWNFFEEMGIGISRALLDETIAKEFFHGLAASEWQEARATIIEMRTQGPGPSLFANFENLVDTVGRALTPPIWLDERGQPRPKRPCPTCGREIAVVTFPPEHLRSWGWQPLQLSGYVEWCGHRIEGILSAGR